MSGTVQRGHATISIFLFLLFAVSVEAATIKVGSATVSSQHSEQGQLCVSLETRASEQVAGTENLLLWDGDCATMVEGSCEATSGHGKSLSGSLQKQRDFTYKALVLSFNDTNPIPAGQLYCCDFLVHAAPGDCCRVTVGSPGGSDPNGNSVSVGAGPPGELCVAYDGQRPSGGQAGGNTFAGGGVSGGGIAPGGAAQPGGAPAPLGGGGAPASGFANSRDDEAPLDVDADRVFDPPPAPGANVAPAAPRAEPAPANPEPAAPPPAAPRAPGAAPDVAPATAGAATPAAAVPTPASPAAPLDSAPVAEEAEAGATGGEDALEEEAPPAPKRAEEGQPKPSPRDVQRADRPRQFPLDDDGCHTTRATGAAPAALALPLLALLLARRRRRI